MKSLTNQLNYLLLTNSELTKDLFEFTALNSVIQRCRLHVLELDNLKIREKTTNFYTCLGFKL